MLARTILADAARTTSSDEALVMTGAAAGTGATGAVRPWWRSAQVRGEPLLDVAVGPLGDGGAGGQAVEAVRGAGVHHQVHGHPGVAEAHGVLDVLVGEPVDRTDGDERRWQPRRSVARAGAAYAGTSGPPLRSPRYAVHPYVLALGGQIGSAHPLDVVVWRSSSIG